MASNSCLETMAGAAVGSPPPTSRLSVHTGPSTPGRRGEAMEAVLVWTVCWYGSAQGNMNYFFYLLFLSKMESKR